MVIQDGDYRNEGNGREVELEKPTGSRYEFHLQALVPGINIESGLFGVLGLDEEDGNLTLTLESKNDDWNGTVLRRE